MLRARIIRDQRGISSVEFAIVCSLFFLIVLGIIDFSRAMWEWNAAAKATQFGVRLAVVSDMVSIKMRDFSGVGAGIKAGKTVPLLTTGTETVICNSAGCNGSADTTTSFNAAAFAAIVARMQTRYSSIGPENVEIVYEHIGMGFSGNPIGPDIDPAVTVRLRNMTFIFVTPGLSGIFNITMPSFAATLTGEDHVTI